MPKVDFCEFQALEAQIEGSRAKVYIRRRDTEAGVMVACHLCGLLVAHHVLGGLGWEKWHSLVEAGNPNLTSRDFS